jgi:type II secretory pathway pseudopilin PulG
MLVVIGIIAILAAILMPALSSARKQVREGATRAEIKNLEVAMTAYYQDWGEYPPDMRESGDSSAESLVYHLGNTFRVSAGTGEIDASQNGGPYFDFDPKRLEEGRYVDHLGEADRTVCYYQFDNNEADGGDDSNWHTSFDNDDTSDGGHGHGGWNVSNVHPSGIDIWSAGEDGKDFVYRNNTNDWDSNPTTDRHPTQANPDEKDGDDIGNW